MRTQDVVLGHVLLQDQGQVELGGLAREGARGRQQRVLHHLLRDGGPAPQAPQGQHGPGHPTGVHARVLEKAAVLARQDCGGSSRRALLVGPLRTQPPAQQSRSWVRC